MRRTTEWIGASALALTLGLSGCAPPTAASASAHGPLMKGITVKAQSSHVLVLLYHDIRPWSKDHTVQYDITPEEFTRQMAVLHNQGANIITLDQLYDHLTEGTQVPERSVVLTFDDNYKGVDTYAAPLLKSFGWAYSIFVHTDYVGNLHVGRPKNSWQDLRTLSQTSKLTVGSHTASHPQNISEAPVGTLWRELKGSADAIKEHLGTSPQYLAWPGGHYDANTIQWASAAGYRMAFGMEVGLAEHSPSIMEVMRVPFYQFTWGWEALKAEEDSGFRFTELPLNNRPFSEFRAKLGGQWLTVITGGKPKLTISEPGAGLLDAAAKLGPGYAFAADDGSAAAHGPYLLSDSSPFKPCEYSNFAPKETPMVIWDEKTIAFMPFRFKSMNSEQALKEYMPSIKGAIKTEKWLVNRGEIVVESGVREKAFRGTALGAKADGSVVVILSEKPVSSRLMAEAAHAQGCVEAVLLGTGGQVQAANTDKFLTGSGLKAKGSRLTIVLTDRETAQVKPTEEPVEPARPK